MATRNRYGELKAETCVNLPDSRVLVVTTSKRSSGQLATIASVVKRQNGFDIFVIFQDYNKTVLSETVKRVTAKAVDSQHSAALETLPGILADVGEFYKFDAPMTV